MTFWSSPGQTFLISLFSGEIRAELSLSDGEFAGIYSLATLASAIVMIWSGALIDRMDLKRLSIAIDQSKSGKVIGVPLNNEAVLVLRNQQGKHGCRGFTYKVSLFRRQIPRHGGKLWLVLGYRIFAGTI